MGRDTYLDTLVIIARAKNAKKPEISGDLGQIKGRH